MNSPRKIQTGTFSGSYTASRRVGWGRVMIFATVALMVFGLAGWLAWQSEVSRRLDPDIYRAALASSEDMPFQYLNEVQRNARFQKHAGITMDAYLKNPRKIQDVEDQYLSAQLLDSGFHHEESLVLYREVIESAQMKGEKEGELLEQALVAAATADDRAAYDDIYSKYKTYLNDIDLGEDYTTQSLEMFRWQDEE